jgi:hypothetical protein
MSVRPYGTTSTGNIFVKLLIAVFYKTCQDNSRFINIGQKQDALFEDLLQLITSFVTSLTVTVVVTTITLLPMLLKFLWLPVTIVAIVTEFTTHIPITLCALFSESLSCHMLLGARAGAYSVSLC